MPRKSKSEKAQETLVKMKEHRIEDSIALREDIKAKLEWAIEERKKGLEVIEKQVKQIKENQNTLLELTGIIKVLTQLLEPKIKEESKSEEEKKVE